MFYAPKCRDEKNRQMAILVEEDKTCTSIILMGEKEDLSTEQNFLSISNTNAIKPTKGNKTPKSSYNKEFSSLPLYLE